MTRNEVFEFILDVLDESSELDMIEIHNNYCDYCYYFEDKIYPMDMLDDVLSSYTPAEIISKVSPSFDNDDYYFIDGIYGLESDCDPYNWMYRSDIVNEMIDSVQDFGLDIDIDELVENLEDTEEV